MIKNIEIKYNEKLAKYSTIKIGGKAKIMAFPKDVKELKRCLAFARERKEKLFILGNGSNTLFDDNGFDGVVINMTNVNKLNWYKNGAYVGAGVKLFVLNTKLAENGYSGLEWSYGIPGSVGGFVFMNGGSFGHEIAELVEYIDVLKQDRVLRLHRDEIHFAYRHSSIDGIILGVKLKLKREAKTKVQKNMMAYLEKKKALQPYDMPSLGSVFKRVQFQNEVLFPAKMIDSLGLKGVKIGGAEVSQKHAGFIVNNGNATAADVKELIEFLMRKINTLGVEVETEIVIVER